MKKPILHFLVSTILLVNISYSQKIVPVYEEPRHVPLLYNKYVRVVEATIEPGDTSLFHTHASSSAFAVLSDVGYRNQVLGAGWTDMQFKKGHSWYNSYTDGPATHRVAAIPDNPIHVYDVEILGKWAIVENTNWKPLPLDTIFVSDKCVGYRLELTSDKPSFTCAGRGPTIAILLSGELVNISQPDTRVEIGMEEDDYGYIRGGYPCSIVLKEGEKASLILFEVR